MLAELSTLEKALGKSDLSGQVRPLDEILRALRAQRATSLDALDLNTRGRLITTLARVSRQPRPAPLAPGVPGTEPSTTVPPEQVAQSPGISEGSPELTEQKAEEVQAEAETAPVPEAGGAGAPPPPVEDKPKAYADVMYRLALIWRSLNEGERSDAALAQSGRALDPKDLERLSAPPEAGPKERERKEGGRRQGRPERGPRRREHGASEQPMPAFPEGMDWSEQAKQLEERGRTRDAGRLHERHGSHADAARLFEAGGDLKSALRNAALAKDGASAKRLMASITPEESVATLEKAEAYELLMELYVERGQFDQVARLYERARQFDQAALAWERAGKLANARRAFERARDVPNAQRLRKLEVDKLVERGDRLGAALLLVQAGERDEALEVLKALPAPKQYRFLSKLKLTEQAEALARAELAKADEEKRPSARARWLEILGDLPGAAQAWEAAERKDKAFPLYEKLGDLGKAASLAEAAGHRDAALLLYRRAGDEASAARVEAMPQVELPPAPPEPGEEAPEVGQEHQ